MEKQKYFVKSNLIRTGQVFIDSHTGITFGIRQINYDLLSSGSISVPNAKAIDFDNASPGHKWNFTVNQIDYELTLLELNYLQDNYKVQVAEK